MSLNNRTELEKWFDRLWPRLRDVLVFAIGVFLLTKPSLNATQAAVGSACVGITITSIAKYVVKNNNKP